EAIARTKIAASAAQLSKLAARSDRAVPDVAQAYLAIGDALSLDRLRTAAEQALSDMPYWDRLATRGLMRELEQLQSDATQLALQEESPKAWTHRHRRGLKALLQEIKTFTGSKPSFAQFALATDAVRKFMHTASDTKA
ncbi:MAG: hypothetical protein AAGJ51_01810, partial [Pseudomonadota bacterium]